MRCHFSRGSGVTGKLAAQRLASEKPGQTLQATALVRPARSEPSYNPPFSAIN